MRDIIKATIRHSLRRALQSIYTSCKSISNYVNKLKIFIKFCALSAAKGMISIYEKKTKQNYIIINITNYSHNEYYWYGTGSKYYSKIYCFR